MFKEFSNQVQEEHSELVYTVKKCGQILDACETQILIFVQLHSQCASTIHIICV